MEILEIWPHIIVAATPEYVAHGLDDRGFACVVRSDEYVESGL